MKENYDREKLMERLDELKKQIKRLSDILVKFLIKVLKVASVLFAIISITVPTLFFRILSFIGETLMKFSYKGLKYELGFKNKEA